MNPNKVVLKFASKILDVFLSFEMRKELVEQEQLCCSTRHWTTDAGQKMQLPKRPGEGRFSALVWTGYDKDTFLVFQVEIITNNERFIGEKLLGQG